MAPPGELRQAADSSLPPSAAVEPLQLKLEDETWGDWETPVEAPTGAATSTEHAMGFRAELLRRLPAGRCCCRALSGRPDLVAASKL